MAENSRLCPVCARPLEGQAKRAACLRCQNLYHPECWEGLTRCLAFGCVGTPEEALQDLDEPVPAKPCPACNFENPANGAVPLVRADIFENLPARSSRLCRLAGRHSRGPGPEPDRHWENAIQHLYNGDLEFWFSENGRLIWPRRPGRRGATMNSACRAGVLPAGQQSGRPAPDGGSPGDPGLEGPGPTLTSALDPEFGSWLPVWNPVGRGLLADLEPAEFAGNRTRIAVTADPAVPDGAVPGVIRIQAYPALRST